MEWKWWNFDAIKLWHLKLTISTRGSAWQTGCAALHFFLQTRAWSETGVATASLQNIKHTIKVCFSSGFKTIYLQLWWLLFLSLFCCILPLITFAYQTWPWLIAISLISCLTLHLASGTDCVWLRIFICRRWRHYIFTAAPHINLKIIWKSL